MWPLRSFNVAVGKRLKPVLALLVLVTAATSPSIARADVPAAGLMRLSAVTTVTTRWAMLYPAQPLRAPLVESTPLLLEAPRLDRQSPGDAQLAALMTARPALEYKPKDSALTISLEPGSPCTGACLKLAGWF